MDSLKMKLFAAVVVMSMATAVVSNVAAQEAPAAAPGPAFGAGFTITAVANPVLCTVAICHPPSAIRHHRRRTPTKLFIWCPATLREILAPMRPISVRRCCWGDRSLSLLLRRI
ncbi:hypothetical protein R6Q57_003825 [Mikania cordata]